MKNTLKLWSLLLTALTLGAPNWAGADTKPDPDYLPPPDPAPVRHRVFSKDGSGPILPGKLRLTLRSNKGSDGTAKFFPDGCRLVSDNFQIIAGKDGVGRFNGFAQLLSPEGKPLFSGQLRGITGLTAQRGDGEKSRRPGHLEGVFEAFDGPIAVDGSSQSGGGSPLEPPVISPKPGPPTEPPPMPPVFTPRGSLHVSFSADLNTKSASPLPLYRAHLDGVLTLPPPPPPPSGEVTIASDHALYPVGATITAIIENKTRQTIYAFDERSLCTIVQLQKRAGEAWTTQFLCPLLRPALLQEIGLGETRRVALQFSQGAVAPPGTYRLALDYFRTKPLNAPNAKAITIYSIPFRVASEPPTDGSVSITTDKAVYQTTDIIQATVLNESNADIQTADHESFCTILKLMRRTSEGWKMTAPCLLLSPTQRVIIKAGERLSVSLPQAVILIYPPPANFEPGDYRLDLTFVPLDAKGQPDGEYQTASSAPFKVVSGTSPPLASGVRGKVTERLMGGAPPQPGIPPLDIVQPLAGARLILKTGDGKEVGRAVSNQDGSFRISAPPGAYQLFALRPTDGGGLPAPGPQAVRIGLGQVIEINLQFLTPLP